MLPSSASCSAASPSLSNRGTRIFLRSLVLGSALAFAAGSSVTAHAQTGPRVFKVFGEVEPTKHRTPGSKSVARDSYAPTKTAPKTEVAKLAEAILDSRAELGQIETELGALPRFLQEQIEEVGIFLDPQALELADVNPETPIDVELPPMPLRSALRQLLEPHGLKIGVVDEGLLITADFVQLTRRGIATDQWLSGPAGSMKAIVEKMDQPLAVETLDEPLHQIIGLLSENTGIPMVIDNRALEEIGLSAREPITISLEGVTLRSALRLLLRDLELTYVIGDEILEVTTIEAAEQNLQTRIYFLDGLAANKDDAAEMSNLIVKAVVPDTWESLGGPSLSSPFQPKPNSRPALVISTTSDVHDQIDEFLASLRRSQLGSP